MEDVMKFRTFDGSGNNLTKPTLNAAQTDFARLGPAHFADGVSSLVDGPNPRTISNVVVGEGNADIGNAEGLSGMMYAWGQFIDHDLDLAKSGSTTPIDITVPTGDPNLPDGSVISVMRVAIDPATGTDAAHPATAINAITGWLDASMIYGSDAATAASLRLSDGHMKTSPGNNLPIVNGMFQAGDVRAAENPDLTALQTLFVREHNYQVDLLHKLHPHWSGDQLYNQARAIVAAEIAHITYAEFLPHLLGPDALTPYHGYDASVDPRITEEFAGAAFRFGHSIVSGDIEKINEHGQLLSEDSLKDTFFQLPADFAAHTGADALLRALSSDESRAMDGRIIDDLRNFLSDPPDAVDLAAINIQRGRDLGLGTLNETRAALGLAPYTEFSQITHDPGTLAALQQAFGSVDKVDLWTGGLSEDHLPGAMVGETFKTIIAQQFENLRDGDRFWYENQGFDAKTLNLVEHTTLADIIERNTDTQHIQDDVFVFYNRHSGTAGGVEAEDPEAPQLVIGSKGTDTLVGGPQNDVLVAAKGHQTLTGLEGNDKFIFGQPGTDATITDFQPGHDTLELEHVAQHPFQFWGRFGFQLADFRPGHYGAGADHAGKGALSGLHIKYDHGDAVIDAAGYHIRLEGVAPHELTAQDFVLIA
jgi:hypothetical protein